jgi:phage terminase large subunit
MAEAQFIQQLECLFKPKRYKVLYGGRGAGRSWGCAQALLLIGSQRPIRVLCAREYQNSIGESVHKVLSDQIDRLGLGWFYTIEKAKIYGKNGTEFSFEGIKNNTTRIKSYEGVDYCWVEEAVKVSQTSWMILIPTIRKSGSEIWMTFNPELEKDYTYRNWVKDSRLGLASDSALAAAGVLETTDSYVVKMTWRDNPWITPELLREKDELKRKDYDAYLNVWEGHCLQQLDGAIYAKQLRKATADGRITNVPWEPEIPVDTFWDLGRADMTAIWFGQRVAMQYRVLGYYESRGEDIPHYIKECQRRGYVYGTMYLPHDARHRRLGMPKTIEALIRGYGYAVRVVPKLAVADGINAGRLFFNSCWFDETQCEQGLDRLRHYRYRVIDGQFSNEPLHDEASDGADAYRTMAVANMHRVDRASGIVRRLENAAAALRGDAGATLEFGKTRPRAGLGWMQ